MKTGSSIGKLFIVSAPSGAGKTTLVKAVVDDVGHRYSLERVVTYTSREPRKNEVPGHDYHFISVQDFRHRIAQDFFIDWSDTYGHFYGSPRALVHKLDQGKSCILIVDRLGARQIKEQIEASILIWITVSGLQVIRDRLTQRGTDSLSVIERRVALAQKEMEQELVSPFYTHTVLNESFHQAKEALIEIISAEYALEKKSDQDQVKTGFRSGL